MVNIEIQPPAEATQIITYVDRHVLSSSATSVTWDSTQVRDGWHAISVRAFGASGHFLGRSAIWVRSVNGNNHQPTATAACPSHSTPWTTGVSDHKGITFGGCTGARRASDYRCSYTQPVTCTTTAGSANYTISGYTPSSADVGKHLIIGMPYGINGSTSFLGAGGSSSVAVGLTLRVEVASVDGHTITGTTFAGGSPSAAAVNSVTNAECDLETDNAPLIQTAVNNLSDGGTLCVPPGAYGIDTGTEITNNATIYCEPGAIFYDARNDNYNGNYIASQGFYFLDDTAGGANGCTWVGTNTGARWSVPGQSQEPDVARPWFSENSSGLTFQHLTDLNMWGDDDVSLSSSGDSGPGTTNTTVTDVYSQGGWVYGPSVTTGSGNTFSNNVQRDVCFDNEPNDAAQAGLTHNNTWNGNVCVNDGAFPGELSASFGSNSNCTENNGCLTTEQIENNTFIGEVYVFPPCTSSGTLAGIWTNNSAQSNSTGNPACGCGGCGF